MLQLLNDFGFTTPWDNSWLGREIERLLVPTRTDNRALVNVYANDEAAKVVVSLPGWEAQWFDLGVEGNTLFLKGETHFEGENAPKLTLNRVVSLPFRVDDATVQATYKNGLLTVDLKRCERDKPRKIQISA